MKNIRFLISAVVSLVILSSFSARGQFFDENFYKKSEAAVSREPQPSSQIRDIQVFGEQTGIAFTDETVWKTSDNGAQWREIILPKSSAQTISAVSFLNEASGSVILVDAQKALLEFIKTNDGGNSWTKTPINLRQEDLLEADLENASLKTAASGDLILIFRAPTTSNFAGKIVYASSDGGQTWKFSERSIDFRRDDSSAQKKSGDWTLQTIGSCENVKSECVQETKIFNRSGEITPPEIRNLARIELETAKLQAQNSVFAQPPAGTTRISLNRGFDKCTAAPVAQMQTWWDTSPFYDSNIYISGRNRGCTQGLLNAAWVNQVSAMGWGLIPTIVGYQSPCSVCTTCQKHSSEAAVAETQGRGEADIAIADANNLGLTKGTVLYYDMERYDDLSGTGACSTPTKAFLKGWTDRLKEQGYISGVYGSPTNAAADWVNITPASRMDAVWMARWNNVVSVFGVAPLADDVWTNHQRIHQYMGGHNETWGGVTFNIDSDIEDAPVAGAAIPKNKTADFDGDGKTDVSVYRPDNGNWYILSSASSSFSAVSFGANNDILAPGDYDGDGKTDLAVFRPSSGTWYFLTKAGVFNSYQFGSDGDIPVPADFNGDGKTDIAVFRPSNGVWYIVNSDSRGTFTFVQFGAGGDKPAPGDYDGDGRADIAVWRPSNGNWYILKSSDGNFYGVPFGNSTDQPAPGDYDGDGKTDLAVFRSGVWYLLQSLNGFSAVQFGQTGDLPATGDFDGDNKADVAVYRPSNGVWYALKSRDGFSATAFGISTDKPITSAYLPK